MRVRTRLPIRPHYPSCLRLPGEMLSGLQMIGSAPTRLAVKIWPREIPTMATTLASVLEGHEPVNCPICSRQLFVSRLEEGKARFDGCGRNCIPVYWVPDDSLILGPQGGLMHVYRRKWRTDEPKPTLIPKYVNLGW